mgnify:FL=1
MKKIIIIFFLVLTSSVSMAHMDHYKKFNKIEMEIIRNDEIIGYNYYFFKRNDDKTIINTQFKFEVKLFGTSVFRVEGFGEETYYKGKLVSYQSKTLQNKKEKFVDLQFNKKTEKFDIKGSSYNGEASSKNIIGNWWNHKILQAESQISPISGSIKDQIVTFVGKENIILNGKNYNTDHFKLNSKDKSIPEDKKLNLDIWVDKETSMIIRVTYQRMGNWEYRLRSFN